MSGAHIERVHFASRRGARLVGLWHTGARATTAILCHGMLLTHGTAAEIVCADANALAVATAGVSTVRQYPVADHCFSDPALLDAVRGDIAGWTLAALERVPSSPAAAAWPDQREGSR